MPNDPKSKLVELTRVYDGRPFSISQYYLAELSDGHFTLESARGQRDKTCAWCSLISGDTVRKIAATGSVDNLIDNFPLLVALTKASGEGKVAINPRVLVEVGSGYYTNAEGRELPCTWVVWTSGDYTRKAAVLEPYEEVASKFGLRAAS